MLLLLIVKVPKMFGVRLGESKKNSRFLGVVPPASRPACEERPP